MAAGGRELKIPRAVRAGRSFSLAGADSSSTPGFGGSKQDAQELMKDRADELSELQERLFANGRDGSGPALLLVVQGMDTAGKGGIMRHVVGQVDPQGVAIKAFKAPTREELAHPFLWRIRKALPGPGMIGVFDRSHYEDVLIVRVHDLVPREVWSRRYAQINAFEEKVAASGTRIVKVMLHISREEQHERLAKRLARRDKHWKFNPKDIDERAHWDAYMEAYQAVLEKTGTKVAPWHVVPADKKWFARLAVSELLLANLRAMKLTWPPADFDVAHEKRRLAES